VSARAVPDAYPTPVHTPMACMVNGQPQALDVAAHHTLLDVLRDQLGLTGTKSCCEQGECGACTVLIDGHAVNACLVLAMEADGRAIVTIEGLAADDRLDPVQDAFLEQGAVQCGFCIPGMIMSAKYLLTHTPSPSVDEIKDALAGNLCRCAGYSRIVAAVVDAATRQEGA
jgi:aerobic carbon-monoxide dehydrogenase small subunit